MVTNAQIPIRSQESFRNKPFSGERLTDRRTMAMRHQSCFQDQNVGTGTDWSALWARGHTEGAGTKLAVTGRVSLELHHSGEIANFYSVL